VHVEENEGLNLRAGSKRHQHIAEIKKTDGNSTHFALVELELPAGSEDSPSESQ
jgi:hypothetical protein